MLIDDIARFVTLPWYHGPTALRFLARSNQGNLTRDENPETHFCISFVPYDMATRKVFMVLHAKSGLWISPGEHIDARESLSETLRRGVKEELGVDYLPRENLVPFHITITPINNPAHACRMHYDIWYAIPLDGRDFKPDSREFRETRWLSIAEAYELVTDPANLEILTKIAAWFTPAPDF